MVHLEGDGDHGVDEAMSMPVRMATSSPTQTLWNVMAPHTRVRAVTLMMPSRAMFTTPPRSENTPPRAAKAMGEEISRPLTRKKPRKEKSISCTSFLRSARTTRTMTSLMTTMNRIIRPWMA